MIYLLNLFIAFLSPRFEPAFEEDGDEPGLPTKADEEFKPFVRRLPEFKFWCAKRYLLVPSIHASFAFGYGFAMSVLIRSHCPCRVSAFKAVLFSLTLTMFNAFDVPVFWPILVMYFFILFTITMKRQIKHMIKYRYLPFTTGSSWPVC